MCSGLKEERKMEKYIKKVSDLMTPESVLKYK